MSESTAGTLETREDAGEGQSGVVRLWLDALSIADKEEKTWREAAAEVVRVYRDEPKDGNKATGGSKTKFNVLYSNTETLAPAVYNSPPIPDVRRRFRDPDPVGKVAAQLLERNLSFAIDSTDFSARMDDAVKDTLLPGRGLVRVRYEPQMAEDGTIGAEKISCETVDWRRFRRGPGKTWADVPWVAFEHFLTREEFKKLSPKVGARIELDCSLLTGEAGKGEPEPDQMKRGRVWEIWDREAKEVLFVAPAWPSGPVYTGEDPLGLRDFFPVPRPIYALETPGDLTPVPPYHAYKGLADDLEAISRRIGRLVRALKWRGAYLDVAMGDFMTKFEGLEDGALLPIENPLALQNGGLDKAFWFQPIEILSGVLVQLGEQRETLKQQIYEITGISDIVRGASQASETATAQQIKAQWGSLRVQKLQREVQRFARDLLRIMGEIVAEKFQPQTIFAVAGMKIPTQAEMQQAQMQAQIAQATGQQAPPPPQGPSQEEVIQFLRTQTLRDYMVDIETDSTIRADLTREQANITQFVQGFGQFIQSIGPAVQAGFVSQKEAATLLKSFARSFKLGRDAEDAIEQLGEVPPPPPTAQQDPAKVEEIKAQSAIKQAEMKNAADAQAAALKAQNDKQIAADKLASDMQLERERIASQERIEAQRLEAEKERHKESLDAEVAKAHIAAAASVEAVKHKPAAETAH